MSGEVGTKHRAGAGVTHRRPAVLSVLLVLLAFGSAAGLWKTTVGAATVAAEFPRLGAGFVRVLVVVPLSFLLTLAWLWRMRPWAYRLQLVLGVAVVMIDLWSGNRVHALVTGIATALLVACLGPARRKVIGW